MKPHGQPNRPCHTSAGETYADLARFERDICLRPGVVVRPGQQQPETAAERAPQNKWLILALVIVGTFMTTLDASMDRGCPRKKSETRTRRCSASRPVRDRGSSSTVASAAGSARAA